MPKKNMSKSQAEKKIDEFFKNMRGKSPKEVKKIKKLAMSYNIKLGNMRKKFCKRCYTPFTSKTSEIRIKKGFKITECLNCGYVSRWKLK